MEEFWVNFHFLRPWYLLLLLLPLFFYLRYYNKYSNISSWEQVCDKKLLPYILVKGSSKSRKLLVSLAYFAFVFCVLAISGPSWKKIELPVISAENPVMILLNLSSDMKQKDITPSRLDRAKFEVMDLMSELKSANVGLIVYSDEPYLVSPITSDVKLIKNLMPAISYSIMPSDGDRLDRAINLAIEKFVAGGYNQGNIVIFSSDIGQKFDLALEQAKIAKADNYEIDVVSFNSSPVEKLKLIAKTGGGTYSNANIDAIVGNINAKNAEVKQGKNLQSVWLDYGYYLLFVPLLCCLFMFRKAILLIVFVLGFSNIANAGFFTNANQDGLKSFNEGDYNKAFEQFEDETWLGASAYKKGDYQRSYEYYKKSDDVTSKYNQGNALAKSGKIDEAIKKYEEVLAQAPHHEDAKFNLEYLKKQQEQQNQQNQNNQDNQNQDKNNQDQNNQDNQDKNNQDNQDNSSQENKGSENNKNEQNQSNSSNENNNQDANDKEQSPDNKEEQNADNDSKPKPQNSESNEEKEAPLELQKGDEDNKYDEKAQAKAQQYREIPEDTGGLLRAFIRKEYNKDRYKND